MSSVGSGLQLLLLAACLLADLHGVIGYGYRDDSTRDRLIRIEKKLDILTNEMGRLTDTGAQDTQDSPRLEPVDLVSVERTHGPDGNIFTVSFTKNIPEVFYVATVDRDTIVSGIDVDDSDGPSTLSFICGVPYDGETKLDLTFSNRNQSSEVRVELDNSGIQSKLQKDFTVPTLVIHHEGDLVYEPGNDVKVKVSSSSEEDSPGRGFSDVSYRLTAITDEDGEYTVRENTGWIGLLHEKEFLRSRELTYSISTSEHSCSGFFHVSLNFFNNDAPLVKRLYVSRSLVLRPSSQTGPYPEDFLSFPDAFYFSLGSRCIEGSTCTLQCSAIGPITDLEVRKLGLGGEQWETVEDATKTVFDYSATAEWKVRPTKYTNDTKFQCLATSAAKNISMETKMTIMSEQFYIEGNSSVIYIEEDQPGPDSKKLRINCTIIGRPVKRAAIMPMFSIPNRSNSVYASYPRYVEARIIPIRPGESVATVAIRYDPLAQPDDGFQGARCAATSLDYRHEEYNIAWTPPQE
ncbi:hypothetical protein EGW08_018778 [Elysia chlorotica]|uniref:Ig-like domain-containing protein n=1 Tax=Elysia chlorotica TaxID=188477 RepID=A0A433SW10_ELYCH|nr:hypothetical protein EGW08_018778 [Elysia chlorotica]